MRKTIQQLPIKIIAFCAAIVLAWCIVANIYNVGSLFYIAIAILFCVVFIIALRHKNHATVTRAASFVAKNYKVICFSVISGTVFARFAFIAIFTYLPFSDPGTFFTNATSIAAGHGLPNARYVADFPYTYVYDWVLSISMHVFGATSIAVIVPNLVFDILSAVILYHLTKRLLRLQKNPSITLPFFAATLWFISPFTFFFSLLSIPVTLFNTLLLAALYCVLLLYSNLHNKALLATYSVLVGMLFGLADTVRPLATVLFIALFLLYGLVFLKSPRNYSPAWLVVSLVVVFCCFSLVGKGYSEVVSQATGYPTPSNASGWSLFVGTNIKTSGSWNVADGTLRQNVVTATSTPQEMHNTMRSMAIERFDSYTFEQKIELVLKKALVFGGQQKDSTYNMRSYSGIRNHAIFQIIIHVACALFAWFLLVASFTYVITVSKNGRIEQQSSFIVYLLLCFVGLFSAQLLAETVSRYFAPLFVFLTIFTVLYIQVLAQKSTISEDI